MGYYDSEPQAVDGQSDALEVSTTTIDDVDADAGE
jgi:hypothetical protein